MAQPIGLILQQWADLGIFFYVLPFLLIFALVYAILFKINIMGGEAYQNRGVYAIIAISVGLLSLQFDQVPIFFQILFPKVGIGLSVLLTVIILIGLFIDFRKSQGMALAMLGVGGGVGVLVLLSTLNDYSWWTGSFWQQNISSIVAGLILVGLVAVIVNSGKEHGTPSIFFREIPAGVQSK